MPATSSGSHLNKHQQLEIQDLMRIVQYFIGNLRAFGGIFECLKMCILCILLMFIITEFLINRYSCLYL